MFLFPAVLFFISLSLLAFLVPKYFENNTEASIHLETSQKESKSSQNQNAQTKIDKQEQEGNAANNMEKIEKVVESGDTASDILGEYFNSTQIYRLSEKSESVHPLRRIKTGQEYSFYKQDDKITKFVYNIDDEKKLCVDFQNNGFEITKKDIEYNVKKKLVKDEIDSSLFKSIEKRGESVKLAIKLAGIFAWDIDFIRDLRKGDSFELIVEKKFLENEFCGYGRILAAQFVNKGKTYRAFLYSQDESNSEYFRADGRAVRKNFLKAPLNYSRISSTYTWERRHPILDKVRPHLGIDYAAPSGTPIESVADGRIIKKSYAREAGHYLKIRHKNGYVTVYNHMTSYARGIKEGKQVDQGETIGYVGSTGLATGPHLDYRVKKYGEYINPLNIDSKPVEPVPENKIKEFKKSIRPLLAVLNGNKPLYALKSQEDEKAS